MTTPSRRRQLGSSSARSLLLTVLGEFVLPAGEPVWTGTFVHAFAALGVAEKAARQALARTAAEGWILVARHGRLARWDLTAAGRQLLTDGAARIYSFGHDGARWDGHWLVVLASVPPEQRDLRRHLRTRMSWAGFGALSSGAWVCPDPGREAEAAQILDDLGIATATSFVARHGGIGAQTDVVAAAWDLRELERRYAEFIGTFEAGACDDAFVAQTLLVHEWRRFPFIDPQLPAELLPPGWIGAGAAELFRARHSQWQPAARQRWASFCADPGGRPPEPSR
jgi:phenylacetic acid degradation operon negative regulatory protein